MSNNSADGAAYNAAVDTSNEPVGKRAAAAEYYRREIDKANEALERISQKVALAEAHVDNAKTAIEEKEAERDELQEQLSGLEGGA